MRERVNYEKIVTPEGYFIKYPPSTDMDGVLTNIRTHVVSSVNEVLEISYTTRDINSYHAV